MLRIRRIFAGSIVGALAVVGAAVGIGGSAASAATFDHPSAIDPGSIVVTTVDGSTTTTVNKQLRIDASWSVPQGAKAGETFGLTLPPQFAGVATTFSIPAQEDPTKTVADCTVSSDASPVVTCTLTDYVEGRAGVSGSLWFTVKTVRSTESSSVEFVVDGKITPVAVPGGGITPGEPMPAEPEKWSSMTPDGRIAWTLAIPGAKFAETGSIVIDDELAPAGAGMAAHRNVDGTLAVWTTDSTNSDQSTLTGWSGQWNADGTAFHLEIPGPIDASRYYMVTYYTVPEAPSTDATYANTATINGITVRDTQVWSSAGGGVGSGGLTGGFTIGKTVSGAAASAVPADTSFTVAYSYGDPVTTGTLTFTAGRPSQSVVLPVGTVVTLEEVDLPVLDGVRWGVPSFSGTGVNALDGGRAQVTIAAGATLSVSLANSAEKTPVPTPTPTPTLSVPTELPLTGTLATTGSNAPLPLLYAGSAIILLGLALTTATLVRRRHR